MKRTTEVEDPAIDAAIVICIGAAILAYFALGPWALPIALLGAISICAAAESGHDLDQDVGDKADELAEEWRRNRKPNENGIDIRYTINTGGLFDQPVTRVYRYELEDNEKEPRTCLGSVPVPQIPYIQYNPVLPASPSVPDWTALHDFGLRQDD